MSRTMLLFLMVLAASLPLVPAWFYFHRKGLKARWFLVCLGAGFAAVLIVLIVKISAPVSGFVNRNFFLYVFGRIAFTEELCRLAILFPVLSFVWRRRGEGSFESNSAWGGTAGLIAGLGFAAAESAFYAGGDYSLALLRAFSAAPLHGACGARIGSAFTCIRSRPVNAIFLFLTAVIIHGLYDLFILDPNLPSFLSLVIALSAIGSSLIAIRSGSVDLK